MNTLEKSVKHVLGGAEMIKVFVYGTLMRNGHNHQYYLQGQKYLGQAILSGYALYNLGSYPGVVADETGLVLGELYEIDLKTLRRLDILEGNGSLYIRQPVEVQIQDETVEAEVYVWNGEVRPEDKIELCAQPWSEIYIKGVCF